ncbi:MAG: Gldg family protein [Clostridia bacterium]|nr:Gldg family protein [Clostridia bacterium]
MNVKQFLDRRSVRHAGSGTALVALVIALFYLVNLIVLGAANHFSWYFYATEQYDLSISGAADELLADIDTTEHKVEIIFCDIEENVKQSNQLDYVYETAVGLAERYPELIELSFVNMWLDPARVAPYRVAEDGSEQNLNTATVVVDYGGEFVLNSAAAFYTLDDENYVVAYNGEEIFVASILWVTAERHPVAYFTANHGEEIPSSLYRQLTAAGYKIERIDLAAVTEIPEDAGMVVISSPLYDFQRSAADSAYVSELTKLENYLENDGRLYVSMNPTYVEKLPRLCSFLTDYGVTVGLGTVVDHEAALPGSAGYSLITSFADGGIGASLSAQVSAGGRRTVLSYAAPLTLADTEKASVQPVLYSATTAHLLRDGEESEIGRTPLLSVSEVKDSDGILIVASSPFLADTTLMNGEGYGNKTLVNSLLSLVGAERVPSGIPAVQVDRSAIEDLTSREADIYTALAAGVLPALLLVCGLVYHSRRKNR